MKTILVEPAVLENSAQVMEGYQQQYLETIARLYQGIDTLSSGWQGKDNNAFVNQIQGYRDDFQKISSLLTQYIEFLRNAAVAYRQTQEELAAQAMRLTN